MALSEEEINEIAKKVAEKLRKSMQVEPQKPEPKCEFKWEDDTLILECDSTADRERAKDILDKGDVVIKVKPKEGEQRKGR